MKLDKLEQLAKAARDFIQQEASDWTLRNNWLYETEAYELQPYFAKLSPSEILAMIALLRQMREALDDIGDTFDFVLVREALAAFDAFNGE